MVLTDAISRLRHLTGWRYFALLAVLGAVLAAALAPIDAWPLVFVTFAVLLLLTEHSAGGWRYFFSIYAFAYGYFVAGLYWIGIAFFVDAAHFAWLSPLPVLGLPLLLAVFPAAGAWVARRIAGGAEPRRMILFAAGWTLGDWLRGVVLTGFPWNLVGYVWADHPAAGQAAAFIGSHGLGLLTLLAAAGFALALRPAIARRQRLSALLLPAGFALIVVAGFLRIVGGSHGMVDGVWLRLVQPSIPQSAKWEEALRQRHIQKQVALSEAPAAHAPTHIIWAETAIPYLIDEAGTLRKALGRLVPPDGALIAGAIRRRFDQAGRMTVFNSLFALNGAGNIATVYDKVHLVPFGEYLPLRPWLHPLGLDAIAAASVDFSPGVDTNPLLVTGLPPVRPLICYEAIFPDEISESGAARAGVLLNITNDAWFGHSSGPYQHLASARMRAIEQGLPLVRAANNGVSAIIDPYGRIVASLGLDRVGVVDGPLPAALPQTWYARSGDLPALLFSLLAILTGALMHRRRIKH